MPPTLAALMTRPLTTGRLVSPRSLGCSAVTWQALCRDGTLVEVRPGRALVAGEPETSADRAQALLGSVPPDVVVARSWAAWVHAGGPPPSSTHRICVVYRPGTSRPRSMPGLEAVQAALRPWDVVTVDRLRLTSPVRTAMDLATWSPEAQWARDLARLQTDGATLPAAVAQLQRVARWRGSEEAVRRLEAAQLRSSLSEAGTTQACTTASAALDPVMR